MKKLLLIIFLMTISFDSHTEQVANNEQNESSKSEQMNNKDNAHKFDWKSEGKYKLLDSHATLYIPKEYIGLLGDDVCKMRKILEYEDRDAFEAMILIDRENFIFFEYVKDERWEFDLRKFIKEYNSDMEEQKNKCKAYQIINWSKEPIFDQATHTIYWNFELKKNDEFFIVSGAFKLGRYGYEIIKYSTNKSNYLKEPNKFLKIVKNFNFDSGFQYEDYSFADGIVDCFYRIRIVQAGIFFFGLLKKIGIFVLGIVSNLFK